VSGTKYIFEGTESNQVLLHNAHKIFVRKSDIKLDTKNQYLQLRHFTWMTAVGKIQT